MGAQVHLESFCRPLPHQALVGDGHAGAARIIDGRCGVHHQHAHVVSGHDVLLFHHGLSQCHARCGSRRLLYAGARRAPTESLCGHTQHVLPSGRHLRTRSAHRSGGLSAEYAGLRERLRVEPVVLRTGWPVHHAVAVARLHSAPCQRRRRASVERTRSDAGTQGNARDLCHQGVVADVCLRAHLPVAIPFPRSPAGKDERHISAASPLRGRPGTDAH